MFSTNSEWQRKEEEENGNSHSLEDKVQSMSKDAKNIQLNAIDAEAQGSQGAKEHDMPLALS